MKDVVTMFGVGILLLATLVGCGKMSQMTAHYTGYSRECVRSKLHTIYLWRHS